MNPTTIVLCLAVAVIVVVILWRARSGRPSIALGLLAAVFMVLGAVLAMYSWVESSSLPWALGYGAFSLAWGITLVRQVAGFLGRSRE